ncbi:hypothetical protein [Methylocystis parvus]|uniref:hypothetical protein n=1 Tax=Methylocystis parvus TaxID=134 RepID=UPI00036321D4|nr:hypothetical protein [Methylocystis parvus]WBK01024.1 hypothetical protein MMG94_04715 [Methylocystis parvus OBBP]
MGFWRFLSFGNGGAKTDPAIAQIAGAISRNLRALGLHVSVEPFGASFVEIKASTSPKLMTTPGDATASGVALLLAGRFDPPALVFEQINSIEPGLGGRMVAAAMDGLRQRPGALTHVRVNDLSPFQKDGRRWWEHIAERHMDFDWRITHDPDETHWPAGGGVTSDVTRTPGFMRQRDRLAALAREFGHDPRCVTLSPERKSFEFLGQSFASEGEATPDGRVTIYYDPHMSDARLGCCLAHELQHLRYFAVRDAYNAEPSGGPLHRRFEKFTPDLLAAQRGVSNYSNEHWDAWTGAAPPRLFSDELAEGGSEPVNETIAEVAKALYNWGPDVRINPVWRGLREAVDDAYQTLKG